MPIVTAGLGHRVPQFSVCLVLILALGGCGAKHADYPWAKDSRTLKSPDTGPSVQVQPPAETATVPAPETVAQAGPTKTAVSVPDGGAVLLGGQTLAAPASEPAAPFLPEPIANKTQTSNGGDLLTPPQTIVVEEPTRSPIQISTTALYMYGTVGGSVQVPKGGANGTSNADRPRFNSIGIKTANIGDGELGVRWDEHSEAFVGAQIIQLGGGADLGVKTLTTDAVTFPAGAHVASDIRLDWYRVGFRYSFTINTAANGVPDITFTPWASAVILDFGYHLTAPKVAPASRSFTKVGAQIGATFAWRPRGGPLSLEVELGGFPTVSNLPTISVESLYARYHFYEWRRFDFTGLLGVAWEQQQFSDDRPLPDHISANFGPMLLTGVQVKF